MRRYPTDHAGLEILPVDECLRLLASVAVGRVGFVADGEVVVLQEEGSGQVVWAAVADMADRAGCLDRRALAGNTR